MDCRTFRRKHFAFVDDTLPGVELVEMERHRLECAACARLDSDIRRSLLLIRNNLPTIQPSAEFSRRLARRLEVERQRNALPAPLFRGPGVTGFLSMSLGVVAIGILAVGLMERPQAERIA
ncbi:MAG: anti-sigma factor family protein, partial [Gemmatimonadota bacterium]